ncbi:MAG: hypothetical protein IJD89_05425 [Clostridia bacterium]|nr:hypothetical protein [Clostridia bacterium]
MLGCSFSFQAVSSQTTGERIREHIKKAEASKKMGFSLPMQRPNTINSDIVSRETYILVSMKPANKQFAGTFNPDHKTTVAPQKPP